MVKEFNRGDIVYIKNKASLDICLNETSHITAKDRPAIIIQNKLGNFHSPNIIVAVITSKIEKKFKFPTHVPLLNKYLEANSLIMCEHIMTISKKDVIRYIDTANPHVLEQVDKAIIVSLELENEIKRVIGENSLKSVTGDLLEQNLTDEERKALRENYEQAYTHEIHQQIKRQAEEKFDNYYKNESLKKMEIFEQQWRENVQPDLELQLRKTLEKELRITLEEEIRQTLINENDNKELIEERVSLSDKIPEVKYINIDNRVFAIPTDNPELYTVYEQIDNLCSPTLEKVRKNESYLVSLDLLKGMSCVEVAKKYQKTRNAIQCLLTRLRQRKTVYTACAALDFANALDKTSEQYAELKELEYFYRKEQFKSVNRLIEDVEAYQANKRQFIYDNEVDKLYNSVNVDVNEDEDEDEDDFNYHSIYKPKRVKPMQQIFSGDICTYVVTPQVVEILHGEEILHMGSDDFDEFLDEIKDIKKCL